MGGMGASSARSRAFAAPWAAWSAVQEQVAGHVGAPGAEELLQMVPAISQRISNLHGKLVEQGTLAVIAHSTPARALSFGITQKNFSLTHP